MLFVGSAGHRRGGAGDETAQSRTSPLPIRPGAALLFLRVSTTGLLLILLGSLLFAAEHFCHDVQVEMALLKTVHRRRESAAGNRRR